MINSIIREIALSICVIPLMLQDTNIYCKPLPDPFADSFKGKDIHIVLGKYEDSYGKRTWTDSLFLDHSGNIILEKELYSSTRYQYNELGFLTHVMTDNDIPSNYFITYEQKGLYLYQKWYPIKHRRWVFDENDLEVSDRIVVFKLDKKGRIKEEFDSLSDSHTKFKYDDKDKLRAKEIKSTEIGVKKFTWEYIYDKNEKIHRINYFRDKELILSHFFLDGVLKYTKKQNIAIKYHYNYY